MISFYASLRRKLFQASIASALSLALAASVAVRSAQSQMLGEGQILGVAIEILAGLRRAKLTAVAASAGYEAPKVAVRNFEKASSVITATEAGDINRHLLSVLQRKGGRDFHFVDRAHLEILTQEAGQYGTAADKEQHKKTLRENSRADIVIIGTLAGSKKMPTLSYQALVVETGQVLVSTAPRLLNYRLSGPLISAGIDENGGRSEIFSGPGTYRTTVEQAEIRLRQLGYEPGHIDGYLTDETRSALREYQADSALSPSGRLTRKTFQNMFLDARIAN